MFFHHLQLFGISVHVVYSFLCVRDLEKLPRNGDFLACLSAEVAAIQHPGLAECLLGVDVRAGRHAVDGAVESGKRLHCGGSGWSFNLRPAALVGHAAAAVGEIELHGVPLILRSIR